MKLSVLCRMLVFVVLLLGFSVPVRAEDPGPTEQLRPTIDQVITILLDESLKGSANKPERRRLIMETVSAGFDFREMSRRVLGATWHEISAEQQEYFVKQMTKLLENVYIGKLEEYSGQAVQYVGERVKGKRAQVTTAVEHQGQSFPIHYIMQKEQDRWMVYDINIEGVSLIRNYMEQFRSILRQESFDGLIKIIEDKNRSFNGNDAAA